MRLRCGQCQGLMEVPTGASAALFLCPHCRTAVRVPQSVDPTAVGPLEAAAPAPSGTEEPASPGEQPSQRRRFRRGLDAENEDDLDMTPMVDVTFLLLIFFMITSSFALQKALETPPPDREQSAAQARTIEEIEQDDDFVIVRIAKDDTTWVDDREAPSEQDLLVKLREIRQAAMADGGRAPSSLLVLADRDCRHESVVRALDAGNRVGMENVRLATVDEHDF